MFSCYLLYFEYWGTRNQKSLIEWSTLQMQMFERLRHWFFLPHKEIHTYRQHGKWGGRKNGISCSHLKTITLKIQGNAFYSCFLCMMSAVFTQLWLWCVYSFLFYFNMIMWTFSFLIKFLEQIKYLHGSKIKNV